VVGDAFSRHGVPSHQLRRPTVAGNARAEAKISRRR
jgi:hypothetical protein